MSRAVLNVCMYAPSASGGHALYTRELLASLAEVGPGRGVAPELVTCEDLEPEHRSPAYPIHMILPRLVPRSEFRTAVAWAGSRLAYYSRRERAFLDWVTSRRDLGLVHFQEYTPWLAPGHYRALRRRGIGLVFTVHNIFLHWSKNILYRRIRDCSMRVAWRECDALLVHSEGLRAALADFLGPGHPPIHVTPHGVWSGSGRPAAPSAEVNGHDRGHTNGNGLANGHANGNGHTNANGHHDRLLFFGVIRPNKGLHVLLQAMERLPRCDLTVAGAPEEPVYHERVRRMARGLPSGRVEMIDRYVDEGELSDLFGRSRLVVLPYTSFASQSGVLHLALAHNVPVVAADVGALGECVRQWGIGRVVAPGDARALAGAIEQALDPRNYGAAVEAIGRVRGELTWTRMAEATIDAYHAIGS